ncbi:MAG: hypothetical protein RR359_00550 [Bacilli bacterium]
MLKEELLNKEFISVGTQELYLERWMNVNRRFDNFSLKPRGGLWATEFYYFENYVCDWLDFICDHESYSFGMNLEDAVIFKLKKEARVCLLETKEDLQKISKCYPSFHYQLTFFNQKELARYYLIDYEKLSLQYDAVYISYRYAKDNAKEEISFGCDSLIIMNPSVINKYNPLTLIRNEYTGVFNIDEIKEEKVISSLSTDYLNLKRYALMLFKTLIVRFGINYDDYEDYLKQILIYQELMIDQLITFEKDCIVKVINNRLDLTVENIATTIVINCCNEIIKEDLEKFKENFLKYPKKDSKKIYYEDILIKK